MIALRSRRAAPLRYLLFYKPFQVLTQFTAGTAAATGQTPKRTLSDFISIPDVYAAGRLDFDSEGLLLLTNDGELQHRLSDPRFAHPRTYWVQVEGAVTAEALEALSSGVVIQGYRTKPCKAIAEPALPSRDPPIRYRASIPTSWLQLTLTEGRNRQVRRMTAAVGLPTLRLVRVAIGSLKIGTLRPGEWRDITALEVRQLRQWRPLKGS